MLAVPRVDSPPWLELPASWHLPTSPPYHLAVGARELQGSTGEDTICLAIHGLIWGICSLPLSLGKDQVRLVVVAANTQHIRLLTCGSAVGEI